MRIRAGFGGLAALIALSCSPLIMRGQAIVWKAWTGLGTNNSWTTGANWEGSTAPANDGTANVTFGPVNQTSVYVNASQSVRAMKFDFSAGATYPNYYFSGNGTTLTIGSGGLTTLTPTATSAVRPPSPTRLSAGAIANSMPYLSIWFGSGVGIVLGADQTWTVGANGYLGIDGTISGSGKLTLADGYFNFYGNNTYSGGTVLNNAGVSIASNTGFGSGAITVAGSSFIDTYGRYDPSTTATDRTIANALILGGNLTISTLGNLTLSAPVTLTTDASLSNYGRILFVDGNITESGGARKLTIATGNAIVLSGTNTYTGGTNVDYGALIFRYAASVPSANTLAASWSGYLGIAFNTGVQSGFLDRINKANTYGMLGFDTDPSAASPTTFAEPVNLTGFNSDVRLSSATRGVLGSTAVITPPAGTDYNFGGAKGTLTVQSQLTGARNVNVTSWPGNELTLILSHSANNYSGTTRAANSAIVFEPGAMGSGLFRADTDSLGSPTLGGYIGTTDPALAAASFIAKFDPAMISGLIGFDSSSAASPRTITEAINLSAFTAAGTSIGLGTTSAVTISSPLTLPTDQGAYFLSGYKGGQLTVSSTLAGAKAVQIGGVADDSGNVLVRYPVDDPNATRTSTVFLNGNNTYSGGTRLVAGRLVLGHANALGTGPLTVEAKNYYYYSEPKFRLETSLTTNPTFSNGIVLRTNFDYASPVLEIGGGNNFTLSGNISENVLSGVSGIISKSGTSNVTLSGTNSGFSGGFNIADGTLTFATNTAAGTGPLAFNYFGTAPTSATPMASFTSASPMINGLRGYTNYGRINLASGTTLTINENGNSFFGGQLQGAGGIEKTGTGTLTLYGASSTYTGPTKITNGTLEVTTSGALGSNTVTLNGSGARLMVEGTTFSNAIVFGTNGGVLSGYGTFGSAVTLTANSGISPGNSVGTLTFANSLTFGPGSSYRVQVQDAAGGAGIGWDAISVTGTLAFTATTTPVTIFLGSLTATGMAGDAANFTPTNAYSWQIATASGGITGFSAGVVTVNTSGFTNSLGVGSFNVSTAGNALLLNFSPVPEPSTWALLLIGAGAVAVIARRRRG